MLFYVYAPDRPGVSAQMEALAEAHWSYLDRFAGQIVLRGPTLSDDGTEHTGSVHVIDLPDRASADRFATGEPFWRAGFYQHVTATRAVVLIHRKLVDDRFAPGAPSVLVTGQWPARPRDPGPAEPEASLDRRVRFLAALVDDDDSRTTGIVSVVRAHPGEAVGIVRPAADQLSGEPAALTAQRWQRGGRA